MKKFLLTFILLPFIGFTQETQLPTRKTNQIIVNCSDSGSVLFKKVTDIIIDRNFPIQTIIEQSLALYTGEKQVPKWTIPMKLSIRVKDNKVFISGTIYYHLLGSDHVSDIDYVKGPATRSFPQAAWIEMKTVAELLKGQISYTHK